MINTTNTIMIPRIFDCLGIKYRKTDFPGGSLYFCTLPNQLIFDLFEGNDGTIKLWRFVDFAPASKAGMRCEYRKPDDPYSAFGLEVTEEGNLSLYAEQIIHANSPRRESRILRMVEGYSKMVSTAAFKNIGE